LYLLLLLSLWLQVRVPSVLLEVLLLALQALQKRAVSSVLQV
jgi:hypothetical protein